MAKECKITYRNKFLNIIVFKFDGKEVQMTADIPETQDSVSIKLENGSYSIVDTLKEDVGEIPENNLEDKKTTVKNIKTSKSNKVVKAANEEVQ